MKKIFLSLITLLITVAACNKIDATDGVFNITSPVEVSPWDPDYAATVVQKIYMEKFTGHTCIFCPNGARTLKAIMEEDPTVIATAIHCLSQANPGSPTGIFANNYKTPMGDVICNDFGINGLPKATINRMETGDLTTRGIAPSGWRTFLAGIDRNNVKAGIQLYCTVNETQKEIEAKVEVTIIKEIPNPVQICLILQQDSIISAQMDGSSSNIDTNYVHLHMLRAGFNGNYGTRLTPNGIVSAQTKYTTTFRLSYENSFPYSNNIPLVIKHSSVVAYLIDMVTKEVIQVEEVRL
jgi:hypothetical protein